MKRIATADTTRTLIEATTAALSFSLYTAAPDGEYAAGDAALSLTAEGLCRYAVGGTAKTDVLLGKPNTLSSLCCRDIAGMAPGIAYTVLVHAGPDVSLCLSCGYEQDEKTEFTADGSLLCTFVPAEGVGSFDLVLYADGRKVMLVRLSFSLPALPEQERPHLCRATSDATRRAVTQLLGARRTHPHADDPLSAELLAGLAEEVFASVERAAQSRTERGLRRLFPTLLTYPDAPPFDLLKYFLFETDRRLSLLAGAAQIRDREVLLSAERKAARLLSGRFRRVRAAAVTDPFLEAVAAGADITQAEGAYLAFCRGADACLHLGVASAALARADAARTELQMAGLLCPAGVALPQQAAEAFLPEPYRTATLSAPPGIFHLAAPLSADDPTAFETAGGVVSFAAFLRESILPAITEADRASLSAGKEAQAEGVNWDEPDMLVGSLGSSGQLAANLRGRFYYAPVRSLPAQMPSVRYVAIYQSRRSEEPGIRYFGRVTKTLVLPRRDIPYPLHHNNPEEPYYYFEVKRWLKAKRPVFVREEGVYAPRFTWLFLFLHARESFELFHVRSEADFRLMQTLRRMAEQPKSPAEGKSIRLPLGNDLYLESGGTRLTLWQGDELRLQFAHEAFARAPLRVFTQLRRAVRAVAQTPAASAQAPAQKKPGTATSPQAPERQTETALPQHTSQK